MEANNHSHSSAFAKAESIISEVKDSEKKAEAILEKAKKDASILLQEAKAEAVALLKQEEEMLAKEHEKKLSELREKLALSKESGQEAVAKETSELKARAKKNKSKAISHITKVFEDRISYE